MKKYALFLVWAVFLVSCEPEPTPNNTVSIKFNINAGASALLYDTDYLVGTDTVQFTEVKFYVSQPVFSSGADVIAFNDSYFLADAAQSNNTFVVGDVGKRTIDGVAFGFGVDSSRNTQNGSKALQAFSYGVNHPLSASNNMYWSWNPGYVWMKLEGRIDANGDGDFLDVNETFSIHTGIDPAYVFINRTYIFTMNDAPKTIQIDLDVLQFFTGYNLAANPFAHPLTTGSADYPNVVAIQNNANSAFGSFYE